MPEQRELKLLARPKKIIMVVDDEPMLKETLSQLRGHLAV